MTYILEYLNEFLEYEYFELTRTQLWKLISWLDRPANMGRMEFFHLFLADPLAAINEHCSCCSVWIKEQ